MGHNRAGDNARARWRRRLRYDRRLEEKQRAAEGEKKGLLGKVGSAVRNVGKKIKQAVVGEKKA